MRLARLKAGWVFSAAVCVAGLVTAGSAAAERIKLQDGTELSAVVLGRDAASVVVRLPRKEVATVDGQPLPVPVTPGTVAPAFTATDLNGVAQSLEAGRGQVTLLQFWATWCPHCRSDLPLMKQLLAQYGDRGLRILTVSIDQDLEKLKAFLTAQPVLYPVISASAAPELPDRYEARGVPSYFLIDQQGVIAGVWPGSVTETAGKDKPTDLEERLKQLLAPSSA